MSSLKPKKLGGVISIDTSTWFHLIEKEKRTNLEAWCHYFELNPISLAPKESVTWINKIVNVYFNNSYSPLAEDNRQFLQWFKEQPQWNLHWPYLKLVDRCLYFKKTNLIPQLQQQQLQQQTQQPNSYVNHYLETNPYCCLLYSSKSTNCRSIRE
jgi:hypothetical protein